MGKKHSNKTLKKAGQDLQGGTKKEKSKASDVLNKHKKKKH